MYSDDDRGSWHGPVDDHTNIQTTSITFSADNAKSIIVGVRAGNDNGWSAWTDSPTVGPYTPGAVSSVTVTRADGTVTASWDAVQGATKYHSMYSDDDRGSWHGPVDDHTNIQTTSITFSADNAKSIIVGVRAWNDNGWSAWTDSPTVGPYTPPPPGAVPSVSVTRADGTVTASWDAVPGATRYHSMYSDDDRGSWHGPVDDHTKIQTTSITFNADNAKNIIVGVRAGNDNGWSEWRDSPTVGPYTPATPPDAPSGLTATASDGSVTLSWADPSDASITGYEYNVNHNDTSTGNLSGWGPWTAISGSDSATTSHTFTGLTNGREYRYHLRAVNSAGNSTAAPNEAPWFASAIPAIPVPDAPANLSVTPGDGYLDLSWDAVSDATGYDIRAKTSNSNSWHSVATDVTATSYRYTTSETIDYVAVRATNASGGNSEWTEASRLPDHGWLNTVQSSQSSGGASIASANAQNQLAAPSWGTITRGDDTARRSGRIDVNWTGVSNATGYNLVCAVAWSESAGWNWHPCGWVDAATDTVKFTTVPANASQPVGIVSYKRGSESQLPPGIIPLEGSQLAHTTPRSYAVAIRAVSTTPGDASPWVPSASINPLNPLLSNVTDTRTDGQITLSWTPNPWTTGYEIDCAVLGSSYTRCATLSNQDHSATEHSVTISTWTAGGTNYAIGNSSIYDIRICSTNTWGSGCYLAPLIYPNPALTASSVGVTTATLNIAHHTGNWYYKHTNTGATCDGPVSGTSKDLTGLTANTSYTYSAYSDSGCTSAKLLAAAAGFTTLSSVSNLTSTKHPTFESSIHSGQSAAVAFTTGPNPSGYVLKSVTAPLKQASGTSGVIFQLRAMKGTGQYTSTSQVSDASLANLSTATPTASTYTDTTVTCSGSGCSLSRNTTYFIVASNVDVGTGYSWAVSTSETETAQPSGNGWSVGFGHYKQGGRDSIWGSYSDWNPAEIVFATNPSLTAGSIAATSATLSIANHHEAWYYKATSGPHTSCQGPVSAGTSSASLTGLAINTSYTYSAYSDSTCTNANKLATAAEFTTTASLTVSSITDSGATLTINGHTGQWWYQGQVVGGSLGTCTSVPSGSTATLTGLDSNTMYDYKAYDKANCAAADLLTSTRFVTIHPGGGPGFTATDITHNSARLTLSNHTGNWWYQGGSRSGGDGACTAGPSNFVVDLASLSASTAYTYSAYSDNRCRTLITSATTVTFDTLDAPD